MAAMAAETAPTFCSRVILANVLDMRRHDASVWFMILSRRVATSLAEKTAELRLLPADRLHGGRMPPRGGERGSSGDGGTARARAVE